MKQDNLLRDAIAEARQVKAAAIANAKIALEEAFKPHLANMLTTKLRNEIEDHTPAADGYGKEEGGETDVEAVFEQSPLKSSEIGTKDNKESSKAAHSSSKIDNPGQEVKKMEEMKDGAAAPGDAHEKVLSQIDGENFSGTIKEFGEEGFGDDQGDEDPNSMNFGQEPDGDEGGEFGGEQGGSDTLDLEALIRELEADILGQEDPAAGGMSSQMGAPEPQMEDITKLGKANSGHTQTKNMEPHLAPEGEGETLRLSEEDEVEEDINIDELLREMDVQDQGTNPHHYAKVEELQSENVELKQSIKEHRDVIRFLRDRINEINMLNSKLLFTNKLFKAYNLSAGQKMNIVETFDRASTIREVKIIFTTLAETLASKPSSKRAKSITEGLASKPVGSTKPKSPASQQVLTEDTDVVKARFKKLAGIL